MVVKIIPGSQAFPFFRLNKLIKDLEAHYDSIGFMHEIRSCYVHYAEIEHELTKDEEKILSALLTYGPVLDLTDHYNKMLFNAVVSDSLDSLDADVYVLRIIPRLGTISSWSSKASNITDVCNLKGRVKRVERGIALLIKTVSGFPFLENLNDVSMKSCYDRMIQQMYINESPCLERIFLHDKPKPLVHLPLVMPCGSSKDLLCKANKEMGLALDQQEIDYLIHVFVDTLKRDPTDVELFMFAQVNSEHCRHKIFNAKWTIDDRIMKNSLFQMIKNTHEITPDHTISAYSDNSAVIETGHDAYYYSPDFETKEWKSIRERVPMLIKVETHNHPTAVSPFEGAATGSGGEIRDEGATGRGSKFKCGLAGFSVSDLLIPGNVQPWELDIGKPSHIASALDIIIEAPLGSAAFNNEFGRPCINGYFRTLTTKVTNGDLKQEIRGFHKPIMLAGGFGTVRPQFALKNKPITQGSHLIVLGGESMLIGLGGGAASSIVSGEGSTYLDFVSVQRSNPEMERRCQQVIDACVSLGEANPIQSIHDVGAGGLSNALPELVHDHDLGAKIDIRNVISLEPSMSPMEIWCNESQERYVLAVSQQDLKVFKDLCERERAPFSVVGRATADRRLIVEDTLLKTVPIDLDMQILFRNPPKMHITATTKPLSLTGIQLDVIHSLEEAIERVLHMPSVGSKSFLITICDRSVTGLVDRDQFIGPWQTPVSDVGVTATSLGDSIISTGEAIAVGEKPQNALIDAAASAKLAVAESLLNIMAADVQFLSQIKLSANWMLSASHQGEAAKLYEAVMAIGIDLCPDLGISIPVGKDSMSMKMKWADNEVIAPLSLNITAFAPVGNTSKTWTPFMCRKSGTSLVLVDLGSNIQKSMGGSALLHVYNQLGDTSPTVHDNKIFKGFLEALMELHRTDIVKAYHDRSDGGLFVTSLEMVFASRCGLKLILDVENKIDVLIQLFNEELGAVFQIDDLDMPKFETILVKHGVPGSFITIIGTPDFESQDIRIADCSGIEIYRNTRGNLQEIWSFTSHQIQNLRDNPQTSEEEFSLISDNEDPGIHYYLIYNPANDLEIGKELLAIKPKVAILREQGVNGQMEMAWCFQQAGFRAIDVTMTDLVNGKFNLDEFVGLAACGGFSYGDVLGAAAGWAKSILYNDDMRKQFSRFFQERNDTFAFGVCNGCQLLSKLKSIIPGCNSWPSFERNTSTQYEARVCMVEIVYDEKSEQDNVFFNGMVGSRLPIAVAHGEGRVAFASQEQFEEFESQGLTCVRYIDNYGNFTTKFPLNPNGSINGITGIRSPNGRVLAMMPHPERVCRLEANSYYPQDKYEEWGGYGPWIRLFRSTRRWVG